MAGAPAAPGNTASGHEFAVVASLAKASEDTSVVALETPEKPKSADIYRAEALAMANFAQHKGLDPLQVSLQDVENDERWVQDNAS